MEPLLANPVLPVELGRARLARARHELSALTETAHKLVFHRVFGPPDADRAVITSSTVLLLPFHRFEFDAGGFALRFGTMRVGRLGIPIPLSQSKNERVAVWTPAREETPMKSLVRKGGAPLLFDSTPFAAVDVPMAECTLDAESTFPLVQSDVPREAAEQRAKLAAVHAIAPQNAVFGVGGIDTVLTNYDVIRVPAFVVRYHYQGQALIDGGNFSVAVSAYSGRALWELHPPAVRSALGKFRKALSFG